MELNHAALLAFRTRYETLFNAAYNLVSPKIEKIAVKVDSGRVEQVVHRWLRGIPGMREFLDTRTINNVSSDGLTVKNKIWEDTIAIKREELERDQYRLYDPVVGRMGQVAALHRDVIGFGLLSDMLTTPTITAYDGIAFYGNHNSNRVTTSFFNNKSSAVFNESSLKTAFQELKKRRDSAGNVLAATESKPLVVVPPDLWFSANQFQNQSYIVTTQPGTGASSATSQSAMGENILKGTFDLESSAYLKTSTEWHVTLQDPYMKPVIWQIEQDLQFLGYEQFLAQWAMENKFLFGVLGYYNVAPGLPEFAYGSTGV